MYSHARILAFLYAGALQADNKINRPFEEHEGHRGFVANCEPLARRIADHLNSPLFADVFHDGVVEYEVIEPLGQWILNNPTQFDQAYDRFCNEYRDWLIKGDRDLTVDQLCAKHAFEHPLFTRALWIDEVAAEVTLSGYWDWVQHHISA